MPTFGLIAEGPTDLVVLENILIGFFNDYDIPIRPLQPLRDATDAQFGPGGWTRVLEYCGSSFFQEAFEQNDYLIIQIDTDRLNEVPFELNLNQSVETLVAAVVEKFEALLLTSFDDGFLVQYRDKILFAVAVNEIECWLLPLYFTDSKASATNNCLHKLNTILRKRDEVAINPADKKYKYYNQLSTPFCKNKNLIPASAKNPSFHIFLETLRQSFGAGA
jgi:hypothetical protein